MNFKILNRPIMYKQQDKEKSPVDSNGTSDASLTIWGNI
jgi:hypothetical protein